jgi:predicted hydrocarbon binding protein
MGSDDIDITLGGTDQSGASARILTFLARKGYNLKGYQITKTAAGSTLKIKLDPAQLDHARLAADIKSLNPAYCVIQAPILSGAELLKALAGRFPDIDALVQAYASSLTGEAREQGLFEAGKKTGAFVYARDWSLGSPLKMPHALRRALLPALKKMCKVEATDTEVTLLDARFCATGALIHCCEFVSGFMQGFLGASPATKDIKVQRAGCAATGALNCRYAITDGA